MSYEPAGMVRPFVSGCLCAAPSVFAYRAAVRNTGSMMADSVFGSATCWPNHALHPQPPLRWAVASRFKFEFGFWHISTFGFGLYFSRSCLIVTIRCLSISAQQNQSLQSNPAWFECHLARFTFHLRQRLKLVPHRRFYLFNLGNCQPAQSKFVHPLAACRQF